MKRAHDDEEGKKACTQAKMYQQYFAVLQSDAPPKWPKGAVIASPTTAPLPPLMKVVKTITPMSDSPPTTVAPIKVSPKNLFQMFADAQKKKDAVEAQPTPTAVAETSLKEMPVAVAEEVTITTSEVAEASNEPPTTAATLTTPLEVEGGTSALSPLDKIGKPSPTAVMGEEVPYAFVADVLADISSIGSRLECALQLVKMFLEVLDRSPASLIDVVYLTVNKLAPAHEGVELGIGDAILIKVVGEICGMTDKRVREEYNKSGDLAEIAQDRKQRVNTLIKGTALSVHRVLGAFRDIACVQGKEAQRRRGDIIKSLLRDAKGPETNFLIRALQGKMRIGVAELTILTALGHTFALRHVFEKFNDKRLRSMTPEVLQGWLEVGAAGVARIYNEVPSYDILLDAVSTYGFEILDPSTDVCKSNSAALSIRPGIPVRPQLAHPTNGIAAVLSRLDTKKFTCEYKYDGERGQIHFIDGEYHIFSRNSETHTTKYPDVIQFFSGVFDGSSVTSFILDTEVCAVDPNTNKILNFQTLQHRGRKNIDLKDVTIPVCVFAFDILYLNGAPVLHKTLDERRQILFSMFKPIPGKFQFAQYIDSEDVDAIQGFLDVSIQDGAEGLMIKTLHEEANYTPAKRSHYWFKLKKDYMDGVTDTLDLVPIAAYHGKGKRAGVFGGFLLACYNPVTEEYESICKMGTGLSDQDLESMTAKLSGTVIRSGGHNSTLAQPSIESLKPTYYNTNDKPDVWLRESMVWEIKAADLSISPAHMAAVGLVDENKGIALRFPRFIREREDKEPTDATSSEQVADMYRNQALATKAAEINLEDEE